MTWKKFPDESGEAYNSTVSLWLARCAALVYRAPADVVDQLLVQGFKRVDFFDDGLSQAFLAWHPGYDGQAAFAILSFRGTENDYKDILTDLTVLKRPMTNALGCDDNRVHGGFLSALDGIWGTLSSASLQSVLRGGVAGIGRAAERTHSIETHFYGAPGVSDAVAKLDADCRLYITGHSLGGALATLAALRLAHRLTALYTIGSPRALNAALASAFEQNSHLYRIVNAADIVTHVPFVGFRHAGEKQHIVDIKNQPHLSSVIKTGFRLKKSWTLGWAIVVLYLSFMVVLEVHSPGYFLSNNIQLDSEQWVPIEQGATETKLVQVELTLSSSIADQYVDEVIADLSPSTDTILIKALAKVELSNRVAGTVALQLKPEGHFATYLNSSIDFPPEEAIQKINMKVTIPDFDRINEIKLLDILPAKRGPIQALVQELNNYIYYFKLHYLQLLPKKVVDNAVLWTLQLVLFFIPVWLLLAVERYSQRKQMTSKTNIEKTVVQQGLLVALFLLVDLLLEVKMLLPKFNNGWVDNMIYFGLITIMLFGVTKLTQRLPNNVWERMFKYLFYQSLLDHGTEHYCERLERLDRQQEPVACAVKADHIAASVG